MYIKTALTCIALSMLFVAPPLAAIEGTVDDGYLNKFFDTERLVSILTADDQEALKSAQNKVITTEGLLTSSTEAYNEASAQYGEAILAFQSDPETMTMAQAIDNAKAALDELLNDPNAAQEDIDAAQKAYQDALDAYETAKQKAGIPDMEASLTELENTMKEAEDALADAQAALAEVQAEFTATEELVGKLSEEQLFALNRALNNAYNEKLLLNIDSEDLQMLIDGNYNKQQINAFTQAFEQEARFTLKSEKFAEMGMTAQAERMANKAESQKQKFQSKVDRFAASTAKVAAKKNAKSAAESAAKHAAKTSAKNAAKSAAKNAAKSAAKNEAKSAAKNAAKQAAKNAAKNAAKHAAKHGNL